MSSTHIQDQPPADNPADIFRQTGEYARMLMEAVKLGNVDLLRAVREHDPFGDTGRNGSAAIGSRVDLNDWQDLASRPIPFIADHLPRKAVSILAAPGGTGKSLLSIALALGVCRGETLIPSWPCNQGRVTLISTEDAPEVVVRRIADCGHAHGMDAAAITQALGNLTLFCNGGRPVLQESIAGGAILTAAATEIKMAIKSTWPDLIIIDPLIRFYGASENNNSVAALFVDFWGKIADECFASVLLLHHTTKTARDADSVSATHIRGAGAFLDQARSALTLSPGENGGLVLRHVKSNYAPLGKTVALQILDGAISECVHDPEAVAAAIEGYLRDNSEARVTLSGIVKDSRGDSRELRRYVAAQCPWASGQKIAEIARFLVRTGRVRLTPKKVGKRTCEVLTVQGLN